MEVFWETLTGFRFLTELFKAQLTDDELSF
jgi:hypothetical protein